jgi:hypothetical protein
MGHNKEKGEEMSAPRTYLRRWSMLLGLALCAATAQAKSGSAHQEPLTAAQAQSLVDRAFAAESRAALDQNRPMRYLLRKATPRLATSKEIIETREGAVARLVAQNGQPLNAFDEQRERQRLDGLAQSPSQQSRRKHSADNDARMVLKILRTIPRAFLFQYEGAAIAPNGRAIQKYCFRPNPGFEPPDMETAVLKSMTGELWIDANEERVVRIAGSLQQDTNFAWGILGKLSKGGWLVIDQAEVANHEWRITRVQLKMNLRILFKTKIFDTDETMTNYAPVAAGLDYRQAIQMLRSGR